MKDSTVIRLLTSAILFVLLCVATVQAQSADPLETKCGTRLASERGRVSPAFFGALPQPMQDSIYSPSGRFKLFFDRVGPNASSISFVQLAASEMDSAYDFEVTQLGFPAPAYTRDSQYYFYLLPHPFGAYGATVPIQEGLLTVSPSGLQRVRSYIQIDTGFQENIYATKGRDALRITVFHEFFHLLQFADYGYNSANSYFQELSSVWMEMESTPSVRDYLFTLNAYLSTLDQPFYASPSAGYGQGIFFKYLANKFGPGIIREIWEKYSNVTSEPMRAISFALADHSTNFCKEYMHFGAELFQTGKRFTGRGLLPDPRLLPVNVVKTHVLHRNEPGLDTSFAATLAFFTTGFGDADSCAVVVARDTSRLVLGRGTITVPAEGSYRAEYDRPEVFCDTILCTSPLGVYPNPFVLDANGAGSAYFLASTRATKPVTVILDVYTLAMENVRHLESTDPEPLRGAWNAVWNGRDDNGKRVESGLYLYVVDADGDRRTGKLTVVNR